MAEFKGIFTLRTPRDLLRKLEHDFERLDRDREDVFAAFDFFVTAHHLPEWMFPDDIATAKSYRNSRPILRLVRELGDIAKHYVLTRPPPSQAEEMAHRTSRYGVSPFGTGRYSAGQLLIHLSEEGESALGTSVIDVHDLAILILRHYREELERND